MKNLVFLVFVLFLAFLSCSDDSKRYSSSSFETRSELKKEYQLVKIINIPESEELTAVDCYGQVLENFEWYIHSKNAGTFIPVSYNGNGSFTSLDYENADVLGKISALKASGAVKSDTTYLKCPMYNKTGVIHYNQSIEAKILIFGKRFIKLGYTGTAPIIWIVNPKD